MLRQKDKRSSTMSGNSFRQPWPCHCFMLCDLKGSHLSPLCLPYLTSGWGTGLRPTSSSSQGPCSNPGPRILKLHVQCQPIQNPSSAVSCGVKAMVHAGFPQLLEL